MYLTYAEYQAYGGSLDESTFNEYSFEASTIIDWYTFNRLTKDKVVSEKVKRLMYHLIKTIDLRNKAMSLGTPSASSTGSSETNVSGMIQSQSNDGFSTSYNVLSASKVVDESSINSPQMRATVQGYLQGVKNSLGQDVLYRGLYPNE